MPFDYTTIYNSFEQLKGLDKDDLSYLDLAISLLSQEAPRLAAYKGMLQGRRMLLDTAKGRTQYGITNEQIEEVFSEYSKAENALNSINEVIMLTKMKVKILKENYIN